MYSGIRAGYPRKPRERMESGYVTGMDLFMTLGFFWMVIMLLNAGALPISGRTAENGIGSSDNPMVVYLHADGRSLSIGSPNEETIVWEGAVESIQATLANLGAEKGTPQRMIVASPPDLPSAALYQWVDLIRGIRSMDENPLELSLSIYEKKDTEDDFIAE